MERSDRPDDAAVLTRFEEEILAALAPRGLRERLRLGLGRGWTALQVDARMGGAAVDAPAVRARVERVSVALRGLAVRGRVVHARERMSIYFNTKGPRDIVVDTFRRV